MHMIQSVEPHTTNPHANSTRTTHTQHPTRNQPITERHDGTHNHVDKGALGMFHIQRHQLNTHAHTAVWAHTAATVGTRTHTHTCTTAHTHTCARVQPRTPRHTTAHAGTRAQDQPAKQSHHAAHNNTQGMNPPMHNRSQLSAEPRTDALAHTIAHDLTTRTATTPHRHNTRMHPHNHTQSHTDTPKPFNATAHA